MSRNGYTLNAWRWKCHLEEKQVPSRRRAMEIKEFEEIVKSQWNEKFESLRRARMNLGYFRYGEIKGNAKRYDNIGSAIVRLEEYRRTGNSEFLVDAANLCMIEFTQENHPEFHFESIDDGLHTNQIK